jgi:hypothetical protein
MLEPLRILTVFAACAVMVASGSAVPGTRAALPAHLKALPPGVLAVGPAPYAIHKVAAGESGRLWLPGGERAFKVDSVVQAAEGVSTRFGKIAGMGSGAVTLGPDGGFGRVTDGTRVWFLDIRDGQTYAVMAGEGGLAIAADDVVVRGVVAEGMRKASTVTLGPVRDIDVAALYDPDFAARYPGGLASTRIQHFVALANQALVDSGIAVALQLVHQQLASGAVPPSVLDDVDDMLAVGLAGGSFAGVNLNQLRQNTGADIISFFRVHDMYARDACGVAYFPQGAGQWAFGVNVVVDGEHAGSVCDDYVFAHEIGHNLGAGHQLPDSGFHAGSHAFVRLDQFNTMMGSFGTGKPDRFRRLGYYSNPLIACGNLPCGVAGASDNAGTMNALRSMVADYRASQSGGTPTVPTPVNADSDGDAVIDRIDAFPFDALESVDADGDGRPASRDAFPSNSDEWLDTDGGGLGDNADTDDDNDGVLDGSDAFPLDQSEWADADLDGTGDNADAFDANAYEQRDTDLDGIGDRADTDDDQDGTVDVATLNTAADGELLVADSATDRILRFDGNGLAPLGTLAQLEPGAVTLRSGIAGGPSGEVYFVGASQLRALDRLRSTTPALMLDTATHPQVGTGFPLSPVVLATGDVMLSEMGVGAILVLRPAPSARPVPGLRRINFLLATHLARNAAGQVYLLDGRSGASERWTFSGDPMVSGPTVGFAVGTVTAQTSGGIAVDATVLWWVDRVTGLVRSGCLAACAVAPPTLTVPGGAAAVAVGRDQKVYVAVRSGGVRRFDANGVDEGLVVPASESAAPLALAWVPKILDTSMPALPTPPAPALFADPATTPAVGGSTPPPPPCTTACVVLPVVITPAPGGGGGAPDPALLALLLAALHARRRITSSSARTAEASSSPPRS